MLDSLREDFQAQWQTSPLLRMGGWSIALILLIYLLLLLDDALSLKQLEWRRQAAVVNELESVQQQSYWPALVEELEQQRETLLADTWPADTPGLAKASVREFINNTAGESGLGIRIRQTEFAEPQPLAEGVWQLRGRMSASTEGVTVPWAWIAQMEQHQPLFVIESLDLRVGSRAGVSINIEFRVPLSGLEVETP